MSELMEYTPQMIDVIKSQIAPNITDLELAYCVEVSKKLGLNPLNKEMWFVPRWDSKQGRNVFSPMVGVDGYRLSAERTGLYDGQSSPVFYDKDGKSYDVWLKKENPSACKVVVYKKGCREGFSGVAVWEEYCVVSPKGGIGPMWRKMPSHMLAKCAEVLALRRAFPVMAGAYMEEEVENDNIEGQIINEAKKYDKPKDIAIDYEKPKSLSVEEIAKELKKPVVIEKPAEVIKSAPKPSKQDLELAKIAQSVSWGDEAELNTAKEMISPVGMVKGKKLGELNKTTIKTMYEFFNREQRYIDQYKEFYNALELLFKHN